MITFSLIYTSRRPKQLNAVVQRWLALADKPLDVEMVVCVDGDHPESVAALKELSFPPGVAFHKVVQPEAPFNCVRGWNLAAERSTGKVLIAVSDDFEPPKGWDTALKHLNLSPAHNWLDSDCVVHVNDGYIQNLCTLPIVTRVRYRKFGYFFYPGYQSLFSDTEFTARAELDGVVLKAPHLLFEHHHHDCKKREADSVDKVHSSQERWDQGSAIFYARKKRGFPTPVEAARLKRYAAHLIVTKDDFCLFEVCKRLVEEGCETFYFCVPSHYWSGKPVSTDEVLELSSISDAVAQLGVTTRVIRVDALAVADGADNRAQLETNVRNKFIQHIRQDGFKHILIVDGDELWKPGALAKLDRLVEAQHPDAISFSCVPVIGLPGHPINNAQDTVLAYIGPMSRFDHCRSASGRRLNIAAYDIIHFSATRKTMSEIIAKHRESGHYDDPDYDFEGWFVNVLPKVAVGMRHAHMYKPYQIWPEVRAWTPDEWACIPVSIRPYLTSQCRELEASSTPPVAKVVNKPLQAKIAFKSRSSCKTC